MVDHEAVLDAWDRGVPLPEIGAALGISRQRVHQIAIASGRQLRSIVTCAECQHDYRRGQRPAHRSSIEHRFWRGVPLGLGNDECWEWTRYRLPRGYGRAAAGNGRGMMYAHRLSYEIHHGPLSDGMFACHTCDNPPCVNPAHLFEGTAQDNIDDREAKGRGVWRKAS